MSLKTELIRFVVTPQELDQLDRIMRVNPALENRSQAWRYVLRVAVETVLQNEAQAQARQVEVIHER